MEQLGSGPWQKNDWEPDGATKPPPKPFCKELPPINPNLWPLFGNYIRGRGLDPELAIQNGWYPSTEAGDDAPRVVIPALARGADLNRFWQARLMTGEPYRRYESPHGCRRGDALVVTRSLYGAIFLGNCITEGPMDALAAAEVGFWGIAMLGTNPPPEATEHMLYLVVGGNAPTVVVSDEGAIDVALKWWGGIPGSLILTTYPYKDLAEMPREERRWKLTELLRA